MEQNIFPAEQKYILHRANGVMGMRISLLLVCLDMGINILKLLCAVHILKIIE